MEIGIREIHPSLGLDYKSAKTAALKEERGQNTKEITVVQLS